MKYVHLLLLLILFSCSQKKQEDNKKAVKILTYGMPGPQELEAAKYTVAKKYGFYYYAVAGCVVTLALVDSVKSANKISYHILEQRNGKNWQVKFENEVNAAAEDYVKVKSIVETNRSIKEKDTQLKQEGNMLYYDINPISTGVFNVRAYSWRKVKADYENVDYFLLQVDLKEKRVLNFVKLTK